MPFESEIWSNESVGKRPLNVREAAQYLGLQTRHAPHEEEGCLDLVEGDRSGPADQIEVYRPHDSVNATWCICTTAISLGEYPQTLP
jgi:hypothetical protein